MSRTDRRRAPWSWGLLLLILPPTAALAADGPTVALIRLVPPDAGITLAVSDLRDHLAVLSNSSLARSFGRLPAVRTWFASGGGAKFQRARADIEKAIGVPLATVRDDLLGDAVVLVLHVAPDAPLDSARGLLLAKVRDRSLLLRLIHLANQAEIASGSMVEVGDEGQGDRAYHARRFKSGVRPPDFYKVFDDGTFAWSNSEAILRSVIERKAGATGGLADDPSYRKVRDGLPDRAVVAIFVSPRFASRVVESSSKADDRGAKALARTLRALDGLGAAIEWRDGLVLHIHEVLKSGTADPRLVRWAGDRTTADALSRRVPASALAASVASIDVVAVVDLLIGLVPAGDRPRFDNIILALQGLLLGKSPRDEILPRLGPAILAYVESPATDSGRFPVVGVVELRDEGGRLGIARAIDNALRTILSLQAIDPSRQALGLRVESRQSGPIRVTTLGGPSSSWSYGLGPDCLVVGSTAEAVARFGTSKPETRLAPFKKKYFGDARAYAAVDLVKFAEAARAHRDAMVKRLAAGRGGDPASIGRDFDQALALIDLFEAAFLGVLVAPDASTIHQTIGLIAR